ncbi:MAG: hypothetical protein ACOVN5_11385 [Aquidulcibacter sp.]
MLTDLMVNCKKLPLIKASRAIEVKAVDAAELSRHPDQSRKAANILTLSVFFTGRHLGHPRSSFASASKKS